MTEISEQKDGSFVHAALNSQGSRTFFRNFALSSPSYCTIETTVIFIEQK
jgi:hypothetical protein